MADKPPLVVDSTVSPAIVREMEPDETIPSENSLPTGGTAGQVLTKDSNVQGDASWQDPPAGSGDLVGPNASTDQAIVAFSGTTGKLAQNTPTTVNPSTGSITLPSGATVDGVDISAHAGAGGATHPDVVAAGASGFMSGADKTKLDGIAAGAAALSGATPAPVGTTGSAGVSTGGAPADHVHAHGAQTDPTLHADATEAADGFLAAADKTQLVDLARVREILAAATAGIAPDDSPNTVEVLAVWGQNRWRAGTDTSGFNSAYFYAEVPGSPTYGSTVTTFSSTSNLALYSPMVVPNASSPNSNAPANTEALLNASIYWDDGIPIPPNAFVGGAVFESEMYGQIKIGRPGVLYLVLDPDGDVRLAYGGDNSTLATETHKCIGADSATQIAELGVCSDDGSGNILVTLEGHGLSNGDRVWLTTGNRTIGILPDLEDCGYYWVSNAATDTFKPSTTHPSSPGPATLVPFNQTPGDAAESLELVVTKSTSSGSWKQVKLALNLATNTENSDFVPCRIRIIGCADGRGALDTEDGVLWYVTLETFEMSDRVGTTTTTVVVSEGATASKLWRACANRSGPGKSFSNTGTIWPTGAPMLLASNDYDGSGTDAFITTAHDYAGQLDEIYTTADLTASVPFRSITSSQNNVEATTTLLYVGGDPVGEVLEVFNGRRLLRYRPFTEATRIKSGDSVTFQVFKRVAGTYSAVSGATGTFTAGAVRIGPQTTKLAIRAAMDGAQDGVNVLDIRGGTARLIRNRRR